MQETLALVAHWKIHLVLRDGAQVLYEGKNLVTNKGYEIVAKRLSGLAINAISHVAMGTGATAPVLTQTALIGTEIARQALSFSFIPTTDLQGTATFAGPGSDQTIQEFGVFNAGAAGDMFSRFIVPAFLFGPGDSLGVTWTLRFQ